MKQLFVDSRRADAGPAQRAIRRVRSKWTVLDRRTRFRDLSSMRAERRTAGSSVLQVYSAYDNIGNYLPVLGIWDMLGQQFDTWNIHDPSMDFDFINRNYDGLIIGGAGLLHATFEGFWRMFLEQIQIPAIAWGIGVCLKDSQRHKPDDSRSVSRTIGRTSLERCDLVNVRDSLTAEWYGIESASVTACPTIKHLARFKAGRDRQPMQVLYAAHEPLVGAEETTMIRELLSDLHPDLLQTDNMQQPDFGLEDIVDLYVSSSKVVTTRLHGAIIALGLGIPYVAIARDEKLRSFGARYGGGLVINDIEQLPESLITLSFEKSPTNALAGVEAFGDRSRQWLANL